LIFNKTANNILNEFIPVYLVLDGHDWHQGEIEAEISIRMTQGFHKSLLYPEEWDSDNKINKNTNEGKAGNQSITFDNEIITIYPNPTNGIFTINLTSDVSNLISDVCITDLTGKIVYLKEKNGNNFTVNISDKPNGIYILKILYDNKIISRKIIKQ